MEKGKRYFRNLDSSRMILFLVGEILLMMVMAVVMIIVIIVVIMIVIIILFGT